MSQIPNKQTRFKFRSIDIHCTYEISSFNEIAILKMWFTEKQSVGTVIQPVNQTRVYTTGQQQYGQPPPGYGQLAPSYAQPFYPPSPSNVQKQWTKQLDETSICLNVDIHRRLSFYSITVYFVFRVFTIH